MQGIDDAFQIFLIGIINYQLSFFPSPFYRYTSTELFSQLIL